MAHRFDRVRFRSFDGDHSVMLLDNDPAHAFMPYPAAAVANAPRVRLRG